MRTLKMGEAATLLNVSPNTLRAWERRFGFPTPQRTAGGHRCYLHGEVAALHESLAEGLSVAAAVSRARESLSSDTATLVDALAAFQPSRADAAMESALALRSLEAAIEDVLLPALDELGARRGTDSAPFALAARWADGWLRQARRMAPPPMRTRALLVGDATAGEFDRDAFAVRAFELFCERSGARVMTLPVSNAGRVSDAVRSTSPDAVVIAGGYTHDDDVARWIHGVRSASGPLPIVAFRRGDAQAPAPSTTMPHLAPSPSGAHRQLLRFLEEPDEQRLSFPEGEDVSQRREARG